MKSSIQSQFRANPAYLSPSLQDLFPAGVVCAEMRAAGSPEDLWPAELSQVSRAVPKRVAEFAAGRACARRALAELGVFDWVLLAGQDRQPRWPDGVVGSITHTDGFCAAAVASRRAFVGVGIDTEQVDDVGQELWPTICGPEELAWCTALPPARQGTRAALLFSAKEAFYKAQYPATGEWLEFHDLHVHVEALDTEGRFKVRATRRIAADALADQPVVGRFKFHERWVSAAVAFAAPPR